MISQLADSGLKHPFVRYLLNGVVGTFVHFAVLTFLIEVAGVRSAGIANAVGAIFGITSSFLGSRYFVFNAAHKDLRPQVMKFAAVYACAALLHGTVIWAWTDVAGLDYRLGFLIATGLQVAVTFLANKTFVFRV